MKKLLIILLVSLSIPMAFASSNSFSELKAIDYNNNEITSEIFKDYKVTMVNCFTTWCKYCIKEMPDLEKVNRQLPEGCNIISVCCDAYDSPDVLKKIVERYNISFPVVKYTYDDIGKVFDLRGYPTTLFVDSSGKIIDTIEGCPRKPLETYISYLKKLSK